MSASVGDGCVNEDASGEIDRFVKNLFQKLPGTNLPVKQKNPGKGQGPGGATALYWDGVSVRRLSPWESMRTHSFPPRLITWLQRRRDVTWEDAYRLCGNSIPVGMLTDVVSHIVSILKPQVLDRAAEAMDRCTRRENRSHRADTAASRYPPR